MPSNPLTTSAHGLGSPAPLDGLLAPIAALINEPTNFDDEAVALLDRLTYLSTRGPACDGRIEMLTSFGAAASRLLVEEIDRGAPAGERNWFKLAQTFGITVREARDQFPRRPR